MCTQNNNKMYDSPNSRPGNTKVVNSTGQFCFPDIKTFEGTIATSGIGGLAVSGLTIANASGYLKITTTGDKFEFVAPGTYVKLVGTKKIMNGTYKVKQVIDTNNIVLYAAYVAISEGYLYINKTQKIVGTGTKFKQLPINGMLISFDTTPQAKRIVKIESDTVLYVEDGFVSTLTTAPVMLPMGQDITQVSIKAGGAVAVNGGALASGDIISFQNVNGLNPVYGDATSTTALITVQ